MAVPESGTVITSVTRLMDLQYSTLVRVKLIHQQTDLVTEHESSRFGNFLDFIYNLDVIQ